MKIEISKTALVAGFFSAAVPAFGQSGSEGSSFLLIGLISVAVLVLLAVLLQVSDNLLAIEARQTGADRSGANFSLFPRLAEIFRPAKPAFLSEETVYRLRRGHDINLAGKPESTTIQEMKVGTFALQPPNFIGMMPIPKILVEEGQSVKAGDPIMFDKSRPEIQHVAPVSGEVIAINRGAKRSIAEVVILADKEQQYRKLPAFDYEKKSREELVKYLLENGGWTLFRQRPYNVLADLEEAPANIFISTFDTAPLAPDLNLVVEGRGEAFQAGLNVLGKLTSGSVHLGLDARGETVPSEIFTQAQNVQKHWFSGKHPAGNVGVQIHHIAPIGDGTKVWTLGVQEVITLGAMFTEGRYNAERVIAVTGNEISEPKYVRTMLGASIADLTKDNLRSDHVRYISGDVLSGEQKAGKGYLNFYDDQLTVIKEGDYFELFGWLIPGKFRPTVSRSYPNYLFKSMEYEADTNTHGEKRAFVVTGEYEAMLPMDVYPQHLLKAILINDFERMEGLGIYEVVEEDLALCEFACTSKQPLQQILREGLDLMRAQG